MFILIINKKNCFVNELYIKLSFFCFKKCLCELLHEISIMKRRVDQTRVKVGTLCNINISIMLKVKHHPLVESHKGLHTGYITGNCSAPSDSSAFSSACMLYLSLLDYSYKHTLKSSAIFLQKRLFGKTLHLLSKKI